MLKHQLSGRQAQSALLAKALAQDPLYNWLIKAIEVFALLPHSRPEPYTDPGLKPCEAYHTSKEAKKLK